MRIVFPLLHTVILFFWPINDSVILFREGKYNVSCALVLTNYFCEFQISPNELTVIQSLLSDFGSFFLRKRLFHIKYVHFFSKNVFKKD